MSESLEKVVALTNIPRGVRSRSFLLEDIPNLLEAPVSYPIQVGIWTSGEIQPVNSQSSLPTFWPKLIKISPDCHVQNVRICRCGSSEVFLQATKDIPQGQELLVWFGEDLLIEEMGIPPYLSPKNIRGGNSYVCQDCGKEFEAPNNLKVHLALRCGTLAPETLWTRLSLSSENLILSSTNSFNYFLPKGPYSIKSTHAVVSHPMLIPTSQVSLPSYQPSVALALTNYANTSIQQPINQSIHHDNLNNNGSSNDRSLCISSTGEKNLADPQAQLESIVSNMGKARNGHMCLYCGKLYSRKYGLKIHIRTHTGYKPLHCRICHRPFGDPSNLNKHIRLHSDGNTPYRCDICGKVLVRKRDLERHIRSRHTDTSNNLSQSVVLDCTLARRESSSSTVTLNTR